MSKKKSGGSILSCLEEMIKVGQTMGYCMEGCENDISRIIESQGEDLRFSGQFRGILCAWDPKCYRKSSSTVLDSFVIVRGVWLSTGVDTLLIVVYAPHDKGEKRLLWEYLFSVVKGWKGDVIMTGDFNEVRFKTDRFGSIFHARDAEVFNDFISNSGLEEVPLRGCAFTWCHKSASRMSKLDRFFISDNVWNSFPNLSAITLDRYLSDHRPILLRESVVDYGPSPFKFYHHWLEVDGFRKFVEDTWNAAPGHNLNGISNLMLKLKFLKSKIKEWNSTHSRSSKAALTGLMDELHELDIEIDKGSGSDAKVKWSVEGDENSRFFHGLLNKKQRQLSIRGVMKDGVWVDNPFQVKAEFLNHFTNRFSLPSENCIHMNMSFPNTLTYDHMVDLDSDVSREEVKRAVWDCGTDKSPGSNGFTFGFYRQFWSLIENDVFSAVNHFFIQGEFPKGCNSMFITLIPKIPDANLIKDFRLISLIGSLYKIITKILANRLVPVIGSIVHEVQSAFVAERQIMDGPFILDEIIQWCSRKKKQAIFFKVDFEKAYDSVRWDFLDDVLNKFGFGNKWRGWIQNCLKSSKGSVLVNGSPTAEFQFHKGLKQGDPLSPFLFILIMETLHLSFQRVVDAGMFSGINVSNFVTISHMFFADDAGFVGKWCDQNVDTLVNVLDCFYRASGLKINMSKSKLLGAHVDDYKVTQAANKLGCLVLRTPFLYLGTKVGGHMFRVEAWQEFIDKVKSRLSRWKLKALSIWGRFTLLKSVLAIHGEDGNTGRIVPKNRRSCWLTIVNELNILKDK
nr:putative RNA-directed DNA polymerase, eukaryota, reverse transcriptase zinc-binding domain protein [Tanacetum cinerariifolium]